MVRLGGAKADGRIPSGPRLPLEEVAPRQRAIDEAARAAGRDPAAIRRIANVNGVITDGAATGFLDGPVEHWVETLVSMARDHGFDGFVLAPKEDPLGQTEHFAREVVPAVRAALPRPSTSTPPSEVAGFVIRPGLGPQLPGGPLGVRV